MERNFDGIVPIPELQKSLLNKFRLVFSDLTNGNPSKLKDFHTTLIFGFADLITKRIYSGHIGDGILISFYENSYKIFSDSATGDISNQTFFVDTALGDSRLFRIKTEKIEQNNFIGFIAISDGVEEVWKYTKPLYKNNGMVINPDALQLFLYAEKLNEKDIEKDVLQDRIAKNSDDDCSLALLKISGKQCRVEYKEEIKKLEQIRGIEKNIGTEKVKEIDKNDEIEKKTSSILYRSNLDKNIWRKENVEFNWQKENLNNRTTIKDFSKITNESNSKNIDSFLWFIFGAIAGITLIVSIIIYLFK